MNRAEDRDADLFSSWLEAFVDGQSAPVVEPASDRALHNLTAASTQFHRLSEAWAQEPLAYSGQVSSWEDLMASRAPALPKPAAKAAASVRPRPFSGRWETWNRLASVALVVALIVAIGAGVWRVAGDRGSGGPTEPPATLGLLGGAQSVGDGSVATPNASPTQDTSRTDQATTPVDLLPGIQSAVSRSYGATDQPPNLTDMGSMDVSVYRFKTESYASASYDLLVRNAYVDFELATSNNPKDIVVTEALPDVSDQARLARLDSSGNGGYQSQAYVFALHEQYVFVVMNVTGGPLTAEAPQIAITQASEAAIELAKALIEHGQPSQDPPRFYADGTSTGGDWGFMPAAGDPLLAGLVPQSDQQLFPVDPNSSGANTGYPPDAQDLTGIVGAVYRDYTSADVFVGSQIISLDDMTPMTETERATEQFGTITVFVYQLETAKDANVAYNGLSNGLLASLVGFNQGDGKEVFVSQDLTGVGYRATYAQLKVTSSIGGSIRQDTFQYITAQQGEFVFVIASMSRLGPVDATPVASEATDPMVELATQIVADGQLSPDEPVFAADGSSTGGLWGFMPATGDPLLMGLVPNSDQVLYPVPAPGS